MIRVREIIAESAAAAGLQTIELLSHHRHPEVCRPRHRAMFLSRRLRPDMSYPAIGRMFDGRDHSTVIHAERQVAARLQAGDNAEREGICSTLVRLGLGDDLDAAQLAAREGRLVRSRMVLERRRGELLSELRLIDLQLAELGQDDVA